MPCPHCGHDQWLKFDRLRWQKGKPETAEYLCEGCDAPIYHAPADTFETVNTLGQPLYARMIPDRDRDEWVQLEIESNPLPICTRPQVLRSARRT